MKRSATLAAAFFLLLQLLAPTVDLSAQIWNDGDSTARHGILIIGQGDGSVLQVMPDSLLKLPDVESPWIVFDSSGSITWGPSGTEDSGRRQMRAFMRAPSGPFWLGNGVIATEAEYPCSFLGVEGTDYVGESFMESPTEYPAGEGASIRSVIPGTEAEKAGVHAGDVIVGFDGDRVEGIFRLRTLVQSTEPGQVVSLEILRDGKPMTLGATIGERNPGMPCESIGRTESPEFLERMEGLQLRFDSLRDRFGSMRLERIPHMGGLFSPDSTRMRIDTSGVFFLDLRRGLESELSVLDSCRSKFSAMREGRDSTFRHLFRRFDVRDRDRLGIVLQSIPQQLAEYFQVPTGEHGALVSEVIPGGQAEIAGFRAGDVIIEVNGKRVSSPGDVIEARDRALQSEKFVVVRDGRVVQLTLSGVDDQGDDEDLN